MVDYFSYEQRCSVSITKPRRNFASELVVLLQAITSSLVNIVRVPSDLRRILCGKMLKNIPYRLSSIFNSSLGRLPECGTCVNSLRSCLVNQNCTSLNLSQVRPFLISSTLLRNNEKRENVKIGQDEGTQGEISVPLDRLSKLEDYFPDENTPNLLFDGVRYADLHIVQIQATKNNTKMAVTDAKGVVKMNRSCSIEGFKNARKKTSIAANATGISLGTRMISSGIRTVRIKIAGLGPGRIAGMKGITQAGVQVVSITDITDINYTNNPRPKKRRRV